MCHHPRHAQCTDSTRTWQQPWPWHRPEWRPHPCSTRLLKSAVSCLERAFANWLKNDVVSVDMRPPTSVPRTTRRALLLGPTISGYVRSFLRRALSSTTPSIFSAPLCGDPSQWRAHTTVASTANWHLPNKGRPSITTSSLRPSAALGSARSKSRPGCWL